MLTRPYRCLGVREAHWLTRNIMEIQTGTHLCGGPCTEVDIWSSGLVGKRGQCEVKGDQLKTSLVMSKRKGSSLIGRQCRVSVASLTSTTNQHLDSGGFIELQMRTSNS